MNLAGERDKACGMEGTESGKSNLALSLSGYNQLALLPTKIRKCEDGEAGVPKSGCPKPNPELRYGSAPTKRPSYHNPRVEFIS